MSIVTAGPVLSEIRRLRDEKLTGVLRLRSPRGEFVEMYLREGTIEAASSNVSGQRLGEYLKKDVPDLLLDFDVLAAEAQRQKVLFGEALVRKGFIGQAELGAAVRRQAMELLERVFKDSFLVDSFTNSFEPYYAPAGISFPHVLLVSSRCNAVPFGPEPQMRIALSDGVDLSIFSWNTQELCVLTELQHPNTFQSLLNGTGMVEVNLQRILGVLDSLGVIEISEASDSSNSDEIDHDRLPRHHALVKSSTQGFEHLVPVVTNAVLSERLEAARSEFSFTSEQFKTLKVQISETQSQTGLKVVTVSSPDAEDGKSFVSTNLAFSFARDPGKRVIIIDCDLRCPGVERYLGVTAEPGLLQYLENPHLSPYCYMRRVENLFFMTSGGVAANPIEILSTNAMKQLIECMRRDFHTIILDAPPYTPIADARIATALSDGLILVIRRGKTGYSSIDRALSVIDRKKLLGVVFNDVEPMMFHSSYNSSYYNYGYGLYTNRNKRTIANSPRKYLKY